MCIYFIILLSVYVTVVVFHELKSIKNSICPAVQTLVDGDVSKIIIITLTIILI